MGTTTASLYRSTGQALDASTRRFLAEQPFGTLATRQPDGSIHLVPTWFLFEDDRLYVATWAGSRKTRNAAARPEVTYTVDDRRTATWVSAHGTAEVLHGDAAAAVNGRLREKYLTDVGIEQVGPFMAEHDDATIAITPRGWRSWDYATAMLPALRAAGIAMDDADGWYRP